MPQQEVHNIFKVLQNSVKLEKGLEMRGSIFGSCNEIAMRLLSRTFQYHKSKLVPVFHFISMSSSNVQQSLQNTREHWKESHLFLQFLLLTLGIYLPRSQSFPKIKFDWRILESSDCQHILRFHSENTGVHYSEVWLKNIRGKLFVIYTYSFKICLPNIL